MKENVVSSEILIQNKAEMSFQMERHGTPPPPPTLASLINISNNYTINHYKCRLAIKHQSTKEIFDFMHLYHQYYS